MKNAAAGSDDRGRPHPARALESVGAKNIKRARQDLDLGENLDGIYQELLHFNRARLKVRPFMIACHRRKRFNAVLATERSTCLASMRCSRVLVRRRPRLQRRMSLIFRLLPRLPLPRRNRNRHSALTLHRGQCKGITVRALYAALSYGGLFQAGRQEDRIG